MTAAKKPNTKKKSPKVSKKTAKKTSPKSIKKKTTSPKKKTASPNKTTIVTEKSPLQLVHFAAIKKVWNETHHKGGPTKQAIAKYIQQNFGKTYKKHHIDKALGARDYEVTGEGGARRYGLTEDMKKTKISVMC